MCPTKPTTAVVPFQQPRLSSSLRSLSLEDVNHPETNSAVERLLSSSGVHPPSTFRLLVFVSSCQRDNQTKPNQTTEKVEADGRGQWVSKQRDPYTAHIPYDSAVGRPSVSVAVCGVRRSSKLSAFVVRRSLFVVRRPSFVVRPSLSSSVFGYFVNDSE